MTERNDLWKVLAAVIVGAPGAGWLLMTWLVDLEACGWLELVRLACWFGFAIVSVLVVCIALEIDRCREERQLARESRRWLGMEDLQSRSRRRALEQIRSVEDTPAPKTVIPENVDPDQAGIWHRKAEVNDG